MAHYITDSLEDDEQIVLQGHLHWVSVFKYIISAILVLLIAIGVLVAGYFTTRQELYIVGAVFIVLAVLIYVIRWIFRTRCEFAVTNNRFIQKDGILNVRMTEIPLFKIETVNFCRSLGQRILGTGSIELVGSGGTFHRVNFLKKPMMVIKRTFGTINMNGRMINYKWHLELYE